MNTPLLDTRVVASSSGITLVTLFVMLLVLVFSTSVQAATVLSESFESNTGIFSQSSGDDLDWTINSGHTPSSSTGPSLASQGNNYLYIEASGNGNGYPGKEAIITSSAIDLSTTSSASFSFDYHMYGADMGTLEVQLSADGSNFSAIWNTSGNQGNNWHTATIDASAYSGGDLYVRFRGITGNNYASDISIDNFVVDDISSGGGTAANSGPRSFVERQTSEFRGNFEYVGNTLLHCTSGCTTNNHNASPMSYVDVDGDGSTFNSSSADISLPVDAQVAWAGLYWGGTAGINTSTWSQINATPNLALKNQVKLKTPGGAYQTVTAGVMDTISNSPTSGWSAYQAFADVTSIVQAAGEGMYTVADAQLDYGGGNNNSFTNPNGGWNLVVFYRSDSEKYRHMTIWDGYDFIYFSDANKSFSIDSIRTPPSGSFEAEVAFTCYDGELTNGSGSGDGDFVAIDSTSQKLSNGLNPATNVCNGTISNNGSNVTTRNPADNQNWAFDVDRFNFNSTGAVPNDATSVEAIFGSDNEGIWFGNIVLSSELFIPPEISKSFLNSVAEANINNEMTITLSNPNVSGLLEGIAFSDIYPTGLRSAGSNVVKSNTCGGTLSAATDATTMSFSGGSLAAGASCAITLNVIGLSSAIGSTLTNCTSTVSSTSTDSVGASSCASVDITDAVDRDYGDAPASYGDASHAISTNLYLGYTVPDSESGSQHSYNAYGDGEQVVDGAGTWYLSGDEDGAPSQPVIQHGTYIPLFPVLKMTAMSYSADFIVTNATGSDATLFGWIDFDGDGSFDANEAASATVSDGSNESTVALSWNVPPDVALGTTFIRLRLTSDTSVTISKPANAASDGEVEDFVLAVALDIPPDSPDVTVTSGETPLACQSVIFSDDFDDLSSASNEFLGPNRGTGGGSIITIRDWTVSGGGADTYARVEDVSGLGMGSAVYLGNGAVRRISPAIGSGFTFDSHGRVTNTIDAVELRDAPDDSTPGTTLAGLGTAAHWGPEPVSLSRSFATEVGKTYRLYFKAIPEDPDGSFVPGVMRVDVPGGGVHFKIPGSNEATINYAIEFDATNTTSTITFVNYGHVNASSGIGWCDPASEFNNNPWCTVGGGDANGNELIIDDVLVAESNCGSASISGFVFTDLNGNDNFDAATESGINAMAVSLFNDQGTVGDTSDDVLVASASSGADGSYAFTDVAAGQTYRVEVDATDPDLPTQFELGTLNPLSGIAVSSGSDISDQNFGFEQVINSCPVGQVAVSQTGHATIVILDQGVAYESQALGAPVALDVTTNSANSALVAKNDTLILDMEKLVPGQTMLMLSLGRNNSSGRLNIATSLDNSNYDTIGTYGNNGTLGNGSGNQDVTNYLEITVPAAGARYIRFIREAGGTWLDAVTYYAVCLSDSEVGIINGAVYQDDNSNDTYDTSTEDGLGTITVSLFDDDNGTLITTTETDVNGNYAFNGLTPDKTYRLLVDSADSSLPVGASLGTSNPLTGVAVAAGGITANQNFGFDSVPPISFNTVGEYRFDDCDGNGSWNMDSSGNNNTATGTATIIEADFKDYGCTSASNNSWDMEIPHHTNYEVDSGAVSILLYDHKNIWDDSRIIEKGWSSTILRLSTLQVGDNQHGAIKADLNGNLIDTGEVYFTTQDDDSDGDTQWTHVMLTFGGEGMKLYINGVLKGSNSYTGGIDQVPGDFKMPGMQGYFDEFYIFDGQPTDQQAQGIYNNLVANKNLDGSDRICGCSSSFATISGKVYLDENGNDLLDVAVTNGAGGLQNDLLLLYDFGAGSGNTVYDISGVGSPMNLTIADPSKVTWMFGGGLSIDDSTLLESPADTKLVTALQASNEITVEAWVKPDSLSQSGPARIVTFSNSTSSRNMTLGQQADDYEVRLRTSTNSNNGNSPKTTSADSVESTLQHVVYTRTAAGSARIYVDGTEVTIQTVGGDFSNLDSSHLFVLANELTGDRPWLGDFHRVALYQRALDASEVSDLFAVGYLGSEPLLADITVSLYNDNGTGSTTTDDIFLESVSTAADGSYAFSAMATGQTYRLEVDTADTDLPVSSSIGTTNPLTSVTVVGGVITGDQSFGFDLTQEQPPFTCDASIYIASSTAETLPAQFYSVNTNSSPFALNTIGSTAHGHSYNAMGYREQDNYVYAVKQSSSNLLRLGSNGSIVDLGAISGLPVPSNIWQTYDSGDVFPDGYLYIHEVTTHPEIYKIDVTTTPPSLVQTINLSQSIWLSDFAYNKVDDKVYGVGDQGEKFMIDPVTWAVSTVGSNAPAASYGAAYTDNLGNVYIYKNNPGTFYQVDFGLNGTGTGVMTELSIAPNVSFNDGASCRGAAPVDLPGSIAGNVYIDTDGSNTFHPGSENGISSITVTLLNDADGSTLSTTSTAADGSYSFSGLDASLTYRLETDNTDSDLPTGLLIGTPYPLTGVIVPANGVINNQNFGFDNSTPLKTVGEYRFDDCGGVEWLNDYSVNTNTATGTKKEVHNDGKDYACTSLSAYKSYVEVPHIPAYEMTEGAVSMLIYDHHSVWTIARLLEKSQLSGGDSFDLTMESTTDNLHGTFSVDLNGNTIDTGETFFSVNGAGGDLDTDWVHVMFTFGPQGMRLYVDGQLKGTNAYTGGFGNLDSAFQLPYFSGYYDEFYILDGQPSDAQVQGLYSNLLANKNIDGNDRTCDCSSSIATISGKVYLDENGNDLLDVTAITDAGSLQSDLLLLYNFGVGSGNTVYDISGVGSAMDLTIADPSKVTWISDGGLSIDDATILQSGADTKLVNALQANNELTLEAWIKPENLTQAGPARIVTFSQDTGSRNMMVGQQTSSYNARLRTTTNNLNGSSPSTTAIGDVSTTLQHIVYTRTAAGAARIYVDGVLAASETIDGDLSNLDDSYLFGLANELTGDRPWLGEFYKVALYQRALDASEVSGLFTLGYLDSEPLLADITVSLYNDNGTSSTTADDIFLESVSTAANGSYAFSAMAEGQTYRLEVDITDVDLPAGANIGTTNPLTGVTVAGGVITADQSFGFDIGVCSLVVTTTADNDNAENNSGSLRDAIECANATPGPNTITFNIPTSEAGYNASTGVWTISPTSVLTPLIDGGTTIDATTQAGASCGDLWADVSGRTLKVQLDGSGLSASTNTGLKIIGDDFALRGMAITNFTDFGVTSTSTADNADITCNHIGVAADGMTLGANQAGLYLSGDQPTIGGLNVGDGNVISGNGQLGGVAVIGANGATIHGNFIGTAIDGSTPISNHSGVWNVDSQNLQVGGATNNQRNLISGNVMGITFVGPVNAGSVVQGNYIGTTKTGLAALGNQTGISFDNFSNGITIGGSSAGEGNVVAGNTSSGIGSGSDLGKDSHDNTIINNLIGLAQDGSSLPNQDGIALFEVNDFLIQTNTIANNTRWGILLQNGADEVTITQNSIHSNAALGIDLQGHNGSTATSVGVTQNDSNDVDDGANELLNHPIIEQIVQNATNVNVTYALDVSAGNYRIEFFDNPQGVDPSGHGEGEVFVGFQSISHTGLGVQQFTFTLTGVTLSDVSHLAMTATEDLGAGDLGATSEFSGIEYEVSGQVFEDLQYGGGNGRPFGLPGTVGSNGVRLEVYDVSGQLVTFGNSLNVDGQDGTYSLPLPAGGEYYVRVVSDSVSSTRAGSNGDELGVMTFRTDGTTDVVNEVGGRNPAVNDAGLNDGNSTLNTTTFIFSGGALDGLQAQSVQPIIASVGALEGVSFGFNFNTVVNVNGIGQGSLQQFASNSNLLNSTGIVQQLPAGIVTNYVSGDTVAVFMIPASQLNSSDEAVINNTDVLSIESARTVIDGRVQTANIGSGTISIEGDGSSVTGVSFSEQASGSVLRSIAISQFGGSGVDIYGTGSTASIGITLKNVSIYSNGQYGVLLQNGAKHNQVIGSIISANGWAGIANDAESQNTFSQNSLYDNGTLGIDLGLDGVTANSNDDIWLNYPEVVAGSTISSNGSMIVSYDFDLDVPANTHGYRVEFFSNSVVDPSGHGEGLTYLGYEDIVSSGSGSENFKGSINANQLVPENANIAVTLTEKLGAATLGSTSEFSGVQNGNLSVCTDLLVDPDAPLPTITLDENSTEITYLEAYDEDGNPVTYAISGGADANKFVINPVPPGALFDCVTIEFIKDDGIIGTRNLPVSTTRAGPPPPRPGNYEVPVDSGRDNTYDLIITATDVNGNQVAKAVSVTVQNVNEKPRITNSSDVNFVERQSGVVVDLEVYDPDADDAEGSGISYSISGGVDARQFKVDSSTGKLRFDITPDFDSPADRDADNIYELTVRVMDDQGYASSKNLLVSVTDDPNLNGVALRARALLQGAYVAETGLMNDMLRSLGVLPVLQPYSNQPFNHSGVEQINLDLALVEGNDAIVDWVLLELRAANDLTQVVSSKAGLIQRDGDIVDAATGSAELNFPTATGGQYYMNLRHRNHLGVITAMPVTVSGDVTVVDFSQPTTTVLGEHARLQVAANDGEVAMLWSGDVNQDQRLVVSGQGSDLNPILSDVLTAPENTTYNTSYQFTGYHVSDLNMDGVTLFIGPGNDANVLLGNILLHPANDGFQSNFVGNGGL